METKNTLENYSNELNKQLLSLDSNFSNLLKTLVIGSDSTLADTENDVSHKFEDGICINCEFSEPTGRTSEVPHLEQNILSIIFNF